ncbi:BTAD domain-containing putative transcriptional regulator [Streptomyces humi]
MGGAMRRYELRFGLLGPPVLVDTDDIRPIGSPKVRVLLATLLLAAGRVVSVESLKEALWGGAPPVSAQASLHNHVTRLRRLLDDPERLRAVAPGYLLRVDDGELDADVFDALVAQARAAHGRQEWPAVLRSCADALALWRGAPLSGLPADFGGYSFVQRLEAARLLLLEWRYDAELALGDDRPGGLVPELAALVAEYPFREAYHRQLMLALHRTGRQAEALAVHRDLRNRLREELGIEPGPAIRAAHVEVLRGSGTREPTPPGGVAPGGVAPEAVPSEKAASEKAASEKAASQGAASQGAASEVVGGGDEAGATPSWPVAQFPAPLGGASVSRQQEGDGVREPTESSPPAGSPVRSGGPGEAGPPAGSPVRAGEPTESSPPAGSRVRAGESTESSPPVVSPVRSGGPGEAGPRAESAVRAGESTESSSPVVSPVRSGGPGEAGPRAESAVRAGEPTESSPPVVSPVRSGGPGGAGPRAESPVRAGESTESGPAAESAVRAGEAGGSGAFVASVGGGGSTRADSPAPAPAQLPPAPAHFTGRVDVRAELRGALASAPAPALAVVSGMAGVGKSALALYVAHQVRERFPDGQLHLNLHGATPGVPPLAPGQALAALLRDLGVDPRHIPGHPDAAAALLRSLLAPTRTLLVLDDAASAAQVRPLLPGGPGCAVIVTSRSPLTTLDGARRFPLGPLTGEDSAALLRAVSGREEIGAGHPLVGLTGRLPLALRVVAARLAARRALTPDVLAGQLAATEGRLRHLEYDDLSVRRSLAVAHDALAAADRAPDRDAADALRHIGALDLPTYGAPLIARLTGTDEHRAEAALDRLVDVALLEETAYGRYTPHDLVRDFARELTAGADRTEPALTALRWFAAVAEHVLVAILEPGPDQGDRRRPTTAQPPGHRAYTAAVPPFECAEHAFAWGDLELENIVALVARYADTADTRISAHLSVLVRLLFPYVLRRGRVAEMEVLGTAALAAARRLGDEPAEAYALGDLAGLRFLTGRQRAALDLTDRALAIWRRLEAASWIRRCLNNRGLLLEGLGRYEESGEALRQSLECSRQLNDPYGEAVTRSHLGNLYEHTDPRAAIEQHRRSLAIGDAIGAVIVRHSAHCNIGFAHLTLGEPAAATVHFEESLRILGRHGDWHGESQTRLGLVRALRGLGRTDRAHEECAELLRRADARADRYSGGLARHQLGLLLREQGRTSEAHQVWREALTALDGTDETEVIAELGDLLARPD